MTLSLYNTLTKKKEVFKPIETGKIKIYCCGITAYDYCHLGHGRTCLVWDVVRRYLEWSGYTVNYIQNFTDIDDKILNRAKNENTTMKAVADRFIEAYFEDMEKLNIKKADAYPRATHTLDGIQRLISELEQKDFAYASQGDVYYAVKKFKNYGKLSGRKLKDLQIGASGRVEITDPEASKKQDPCDFALWKGSKEGEPFWESPWGKGRPGWHIECSAMVREHLGETIDLHVGGSDLIFPHHENEIAQSEATTGHPLANYWLHNGMVKIEGEKMSKSLNNFITIRELLEQYDPMAVRLFVLQAHYRKPLDFTNEALEASTNGWHTLKEGLLFGEQFGKQLGFEQLAMDSVNTSEDQTAQPLEEESTENFFSFSFVHDLVQNTGIKLNHKYQRPLTVLGLIIATLTLISLLNGIVNNLNKIAFFPVFFTLIGLIYSIWFSLKYLLTTESRQELQQKINDLIQDLVNENPVKNTIHKKTAGAINKLEKIRQRFQKAIDDDFNFAGGLAVIFELAKELRKEGHILIHQGQTETDPLVLYQNWLTLKELAQVLGLEAKMEEEKPQNGLSDDEIEALIYQRKEARQNKDYAQGDRLRDQLQAQGILLVDQPGGVTTWHRA
jgi:cysteinyl-tRNA synthetase